METLFWISLSIVVYTYVGFFAVVLLLSRVRSRPVAKADIEPRVSLIIAAYNEERVIAGKLENALALDYPREKLEIWVITDGSTDRTPDVVREYEDRGIRLLHQPERAGKTMALNRAVPLTSGEILLFSDANTSYGPDTVRKLMRNFNDPVVGGVSGRKVVRPDAEREATLGERGFWGYEAALKALETRLGSISTADGEIFALRRELFKPIPRDVVHDDMYLTLSLIKRGCRVVYEPEAVSEEAASRSLEDEFHLKTRYASAGYQIIGKFREMLLPPKDFFALQFLSHKVLRWLAPFFLVTLFVSTWVWSSLLMKIFFVLQVLFYYAAFWAYFIEPKKAKSALFYFPLYFCMGNGAALYGFFKFVRGGQTSLWRKAER